MRMLFESDTKLLAYRVRRTIAGAPRQMTGKNCGTSVNVLRINEARAMSKAIKEASRDISTEDTRNWSFITACASCELKQVMMTGKPFLLGVSVGLSQCQQDVGLMMQ